MKSFYEDNKGHQIFKDVRNVDDFYIQLTAAYGNKLNNKEDTLIFLDEISIYPQYFSLLKQLSIDNKYCYICSGSLLDVELNKSGLSPMDYVTIKKMFPMDFEEFLLANGFGKEAIEQVFQSFNKKESLNEGLHNILINHFFISICWWFARLCKNIC